MTLRERKYDIDKVYIVGGGTFSHIRNHLALAAPAFGTTARQLFELAVTRSNTVNLVLTRMADPKSKLVTTDDLSKFALEIVEDPYAKIVFWTPAVVDFDGHVRGNSYSELLDPDPSGPHAERLHTSEGPRMLEIYPAPKILPVFRQGPFGRKDLFLVAFKTTTGATPDVQYKAGLSLLKNTSANLVLANDVVTRLNMVIVPEEARYFETTNREEALEGLVHMAFDRSKNTFTRSQVVSHVGVKWDDPRIPDNLRAVVDHCIARGAYKPFEGKTVGHFAVRGPDGTIITSKRKSNFNHLRETGMVLIRPIGDDRVEAEGGKPSVGGMSQKIIFDTHPKAHCIVHMHVPPKPGASLSTRDQRPYECGSHGCGKNTSEGLREVAPGIQAVMLDNHGPNIVFEKDVPAEQVIEFIEANFDLENKTGGLF